MATSYIVASCKSWHRPGFAKLSTQEKGQWAWVESPDELLQSVKETAGLRYIFFLHWNWHVPTEIWSRFECVCFHMTDVPYGRGGSPLQNLIVAGHKSTKLSALRMVSEMDSGPVYAKRELSLDGRAEDIYLRAGVASFDIIRWMIAAEPEAVPQQGEAVIFRRRKPEQSLLPLEGGLEQVYDHIRMLDAPTYPHAFIQHGNFRLEFSDAQYLEDEIIARVVIRKKPIE
ncbi:MULTISPECIES: methionyl-tRNA formyltransferase [unclassified Herbaspirillum]|uniref:methionyl-tRNA formyltransferase n=1 Tax=unclassified Herbaspirillum TaxID=2624150 RepID=UPI001151A380|nr:MULTISPECIES: methionyl-tRNA formyltransferase [unclassified Herbaspirillum]MBB5392532.1 methionyl-tRNA formyltransferase [Herbaspirillum sp. SJZ102]TQK06169.1 methionyl-tRNA formyltransferase [Herbaspirillum sp. SJZ130]TQK12353.1 methionyl-tRNA formyltransferase [Herbaspirillum sp. SJZ106]